MKKFFCFMLALCLLTLPGCSSAREVGARQPVESSQLQFAGPQPGDPIAVISTTMGEIRVLLYPAIAPMAADNFVGLAQQGYYNGAIFHKVVFGSYIQTGDATGTGNGSSTIWNAPDFPLEASDQLRHYTGALCVAFDQESGRGTSQFYFVTAPQGNLDSSMITKLTDAGYSQEAIDAYQAAGGLPQLDNTDTVLGQIYEGQSVADAISAVKIDKEGRPVQTVSINSINITTYSPPAQPAPEA